MADNIFNEKFGYHDNQLSAPGGVIKISTAVDVAKDSLTLDRSNINISDSKGSFLSFAGGGVMLKSLAELNQTVGTNYHLDVWGDSQFTFSGRWDVYKMGGGAIMDGDKSKQASDAANSIQSSIDKALKAKKDKIASTTVDIPCPTCTQQKTSERTSSLLQAAQQKINLYLPWISAPFRTFVKIVNGLHIPMFDTVPNNSLTKSGTCDHPGCNGSTIKAASPDAGDKAAVDVIKGDSSIQDNEKKLGEEAPTYINGNNVTIQAGHFTHSTEAPYVEVPNAKTHTFGHTANGGPLASSCEGQPKKTMIPVVVDNHPAGIMHIDAASKMELTAGQSGFSFASNGGCEIKTGHIELNAHTADLNLFGACHTHLKGKTIVVEADDNTGDGGIQLNSKRVHATGKLSVDGDFSATGTITCDGTLYAPNLVTKSMSMQTEPAQSAQSIVHSATWNTPPPLSLPSANIQNVYSEAIHILGEVYDGITQANLTLGWLLNTVKRKINLVKLAIPLDNNGLPTGISFMNSIYGTPLKVISPAGLIIGVVVPDYTYVYNSPHNHDNISGQHTHQFHGPEITPCDTTSGFQSQRPSPSHIPTPARGAGTGSSPADSGSLPISVCGGLGGLLAGTGARNQAYGLPGDTNADAFAGKSYVDANVKYNPDGSLAIPPQLSLFRNCNT